MESLTQRHGYVISIHSLRVEGDPVACNFTPEHAISIHSLRVEGDPKKRMEQHGVLHFNPLPPCGGRRRRSRNADGRRGFQSTPSVWRETVTVFRPDTSRDFNPLPPCGGRRCWMCYIGARFPFQSTPSVWRETLLILICMFCAASISIHSLRVEGDDITPPDKRRDSDFNPLPPCGGRPRKRPFELANLSFQSTPSVWRETGYKCGFEKLTRFQSTPSVWRETIWLLR